MQYKPKYPELQDAKWLKLHYCEKKMSTTSIGRLLKCHRTSVLVALKRHKIARRDNSSSAKLIPAKPFGCELLNDKQWLFQKYIKEGLSTFQIADLTGAKNPNSVRQALCRYCIKIRNQREGQIEGRERDGFILTDYTQQVIEGGLLGDAHLCISNKESPICSPAFRKRNKFQDHVEFAENELGCKGRTKKSDVFTFQTLTHDSLREIYNRWYPENNNYVKIVPLDFKLTPISLLHWFLDDGSTSWRKRKYPKHWNQRKQQVLLTFCSESFTKEENEFLCEQIRSLAILCSVIKTNSGTGWRVKVSQSAVRDFFGIIGDSPVDSLGYKWKFPS